MKLFTTVASEGVSERRDDHLINLKKDRSEGTPSLGAAPESRVPAKAKRRIISAPERAKILKDLDNLSHGERGAYMRQLGIYSSQVSTWRKQQLEGLGAKRGPKRKESAALERRLAELESENRKLKSKLKRAALVNELQKKIADALGDSQASPPEADADD